MGVKECERVCTCVGEADLGNGVPSCEVSDTDIATEGNVELRGGEVEVDIVGKGCRPLSGPGGEDGLDGETALALLSLRPRYSAMRSWNEVFTGGKLVGDTLLRSSADLDHPRLEIVRRSPSPPPPLAPLTGLEGVLGVWNRGISADP